jgi:hypothetical protein
LSSRSCPKACDPSQLAKEAHHGDLEDRSARHRFSRPVTSAAAVLSIAITAAPALSRASGDRTPRSHSEWKNAMTMKNDLANRSTICLQTRSQGALTRSSLCENNSASAGVNPLGQLMSRGRCKIPSVIETRLGTRCIPNQLIRLNGTNSLILLCSRKLNVVHRKTVSLLRTESWSPRIWTVFELKYHSGHLVAFWC